MSTTTWPTDERLWQLLADRATAGIGAEEAVELQHLLAERPEVDADALDLTAAAAHVAFMHDQSLRMPPALRRRIMAEAQGLFNDAGHGAEREEDESQRRTTAPTRARDTRYDEPAHPLWLTGQSAGWFAAAAAILLAVVAWLPRGQTTAPRAAATTAAERRLALLESGDAVIIAWTVTDDGASAYRATTGDVVWSTGRQEGYLRLAGMPANDPATRQYQLWIVDPTRDQLPVDGGVFDIPADGEVIVPIDAKLPVHNPQAFAITAEQPGGVVRSAGPLLIVAARPSDAP